jgi:hypothetical protein
MNKITIAALLIFLVAAGCNNTPVQKEEQSAQNTPPKQEQSTQIPSSTFVEENNVFHGTLTLTGYLDVQTRTCNPGDMCGETVEYASFRFSETNDQDIHKFLGPYEGNSFAGASIVGLGCYQKDKNRIFYQNDADSGMIEGEIKGKDLDLLLKSSKDNQVKLTLSREKYTGGRGAPDCYSHFRNFEVNK